MHNFSLFWFSWPSKIIAYKLVSWDHNLSRIINIKWVKIYNHPNIFKEQQQWVMLESINCNETCKLYLFIHVTTIKGSRQNYLFSEVSSKVGPWLKPSIHLTAHDSSIFIEIHMVFFLIVLILIFLLNFSFSWTLLDDA